MHITILPVGLIVLAAVIKASGGYYGNQMTPRQGRVYVIEAPISEDEDYYRPPTPPPPPAPNMMMMPPPVYYNPPMPPQQFITPNFYGNEPQPKEVRHIIHSTKVIKDCDRKREYYPPPPASVQEVVYQPSQTQTQPQSVIIKHVVEQAAPSSKSTSYYERDDDLDRIERRFNEHRERALGEIMAMFDTAKLITDPQEANEYNSNRQKVKDQMDSMFNQMRTSFMQAAEEKRRARSMGY